MPPMTFVKWGGSLITDKTGRFSVRTAVLKRLAREVARAWPAYQGRLLIGHGSGSFGHVAAHDVGLDRHDTPPAAALSRVQDAVATLHRHVVQALREADLPVFSWAPSSAFVTTHGTPAACSAAPVQHALSAGALPVTYGDITLDTADGLAICSTETVFRTLVDALSDTPSAPERVLWCGNTNGVYDDSGTPIDMLTIREARAMINVVDAPDGTDVTGGMAHRLEVACALADQGLNSLLLNGDAPGRLLGALRHNAVPGTRIPRATNTA